MAPSFAPNVTTSEVFSSYQEDYDRLQNSIRDKVAVALTRGSPSEERSTAMREAAEDHQKAERALQQMELEVKSMGALGSTINPRLRAYRTDLASSRRRIREAETALQRDGLALDAPREDKADSDTFTRMRTSTRKLDDAKRSALEAEEIGLGVMNDLHAQRDGIMRTKAHLNDVDDTLNLSKRILSILTYRTQSNQAMVWCIAVLLTIAVLAVAYLKMQKLAAALR